MDTWPPGYYNKCIPVRRVLCHSLTKVTEVPGKSMGTLQNLQAFRVGVRKCYRTHRNSGYCGPGEQSTQKFRAGIKNAAPVPRVFLALECKTYRSSGYGYESHTEVTEVLGAGMGKYPG